MSQHDANIEVLENIIQQWAQNIWLINHPEKNAGDFSTAFYSIGRDLNKFQKLSEQGFVGFVRAASQVDKSEKKLLSRNLLVDEWRRQVWKNHFQKKYAFFEKEAYHLIKKSGMQAVVDAYPADLYPGYDTPGALALMNYKSPMLTIPVIKTMAQKGIQKNKR